MPNFNLNIPDFEALVDLEMALDGYIDDLMGYRHLSDREQETLTNLLFMRNQVINQRAPITEKRVRRRLLGLLP